MNIDMAGQFTMHLLVSFVAGLIIVFPYLLYELWSFVSPALYKSEKKISIIVFFISLFLFLFSLSSLKVRLRRPGGRVGRCVARSGGAPREPAQTGPARKS